jgi:leader peptidase (prepilin peptidase)/N-methyltransferase
MDLFSYIIPIVFGLIIGSFLNVCIFRLPDNRSIVYPGSHCPSCGHAIAWYDNIPLLSYIILRGRCRYCHARISLQYPVVETLTAIVMLLLAYSYPPLHTAKFWVYSIFASSLIVISFIDLKHYIIPDIITMPGIPLGVICSWFFTETGIKNALAGGFTGFLFLLLVAEGYRIITGNDGMGGGDIKLAGMIGTFTGLEGVLFSILFGAMSGAIVGSIILWKTKKDSKTPIPFGPFLSTGAIIYIVYARGWMEIIVQLRY